MMIVMAWLVYCVLIAGMLAAGAEAWERSARWSGRPARWGWLAALAGSVTLPWLLRLIPERTWVEAVPSAAAVLRMEAVVPGAASAGMAWSAAEVGLAVWLTASVATLAYVVVLLMRLMRASRRWRMAELEGGPVLMTGGVGPAAVGVRRGVVVLPAWVMELDAELRSLLLRHEREHVAAGDPRLLLAGLVLLAAMPWNPVIWLQVLRLRNAIELDCDARVLSAGADPSRYGSLLLEVGRRRSAHALVMATFAEPRVFLEQRIRRIAQWPLERRRGRAAMLGATALFLFVGALSCADPLRVQGPNELPRETADRPTVKPGQNLADAPVFTPMTRAPELQNRQDVQTALVRNYPPLLRDAGIGGAPTVHFFIDDQGVVQKVLISKSSGYPALDDAALRVAATMQFTPGYNRDKPVSVWVEIPIVFTAKGAAMPDSVSGDRSRDELLRERMEATRRLEQRRPPAGVPIENGAPADMAEGPVFTPMTKAPELLNRGDVQRALISNYPPLLRDAGIGGAPTLHFFIDETGVVRKTIMSRSSGYPALDEAALEVAKIMRFTPAKNRTRDVPVWVEIPIVFTAK
ncbi:MAG TPA: TonB family protein [Longimicrobiales bacterium]|nr:TonB family protein [Longimicrobiales bacterium]